MFRTWSLLGMVTCVVTSAAIAQDALPSVVQSSLNEQTVLVARIDLTRPDVATISKVLMELPDPSSQFGRASARFGQAFQKLAALDIHEVFVVLSTEGLPNLQPTLVVSTVGRNADRDAIAKSLMAIWQNNVEIAPDGVIVSEAEPERRLLQGRCTGNRPEFVEAFAAIKDAQVQVAIGVSKDARRVLQEFLPQLPSRLGASAVTHITDGWRWIGLGITPSTMPSVRLVVQAKDVRSAESLQQIAVVGLDLAIESEAIKSFFKDTAGLAPLLTPSTESDRLVWSLTQTNNGAVRLMHEVVAPLAGLMETNNRRMRTIDHLKQIGLAMHIYHDNHSNFPPAAVVGGDGRRLISWRVLLLPLLNEKELFEEFRLNEPWDSDHNRKLVSRMPDVFASSTVTRDQRLNGMTTYLGPIAEKTLFAVPEGAAIKQIIDGTSNTIMVVDANAEAAVPWTKPDDLLVDLKQPLKGLEGQADGNFWVLMCDGSVRKVSGKIDAETMRRLLQINDGEVVGDF